MRSGAGSRLRRRDRRAGSSLTRDLVNTPAEGPLAARLRRDLAAEVGAATRLRVPGLRRASAIAGLGLGGLLGVAAGSVEPPRFVKLRFVPPGGSDVAVAFVGKGITFDSGGLSLKPGASMMTMKTDMGGAAAVLGAFTALGALAVGVEVRGYLAITENMPSGSATRPGDVLRTRNGKTIEVLNTDAEGRLVLADALALATEEAPDAIVDLATLTGACVVALGNRIAGVLGNDDRLIAAVRAAGARAGEALWPLPIPTRLPHPHRLRDRPHEEHRRDRAGGSALLGALAPGGVRRRCRPGSISTSPDRSGPRRIAGTSAKGATGLQGEDPSRARVSPLPAIRRYGRGRGRRDRGTAMSHIDEAQATTEVVDGCAGSTSRSRRRRSRGRRRPVRYALAIDVGGTGLKASILDASGKMIADRVRVDTTYPLSPDDFVDAIVKLVQPLPRADRASMGFPGVVRNGRIVTAPHFVTKKGPGTEVVPALLAAWTNFDAASRIGDRLSLPTRILNDADLQGLAVVTGHGLELVITLGTGVGTALFQNGVLAPHLELAHHPFRKNQTYNDQLGEAAFEKIGNKRWRARVALALGELDDLIHYDHCFIGGGNSRHLQGHIKGPVTLVDNVAGILGGIKLWDDTLVPNA